MRIGELARRTGVSPRSLRYYERHGLLHARRDHSGWRAYDEGAVDRVRTIAALLADGLTLHGVKRLAPCLGGHGPSDCADPDLPLHTYRERLAVVDERLSRLQRDRDNLARRISTLPPGGR